MAKKKKIVDDMGCCPTPSKPLGSTDGPDSLMPNGFNGNKFVGLRYTPQPNCGAPVLGNSYGMTRAEFIKWSTGRGVRVDPVGPMETRLKAAGLYEFALSEPTE